MEWQEKVVSVRVLASPDVPASGVALWGMTQTVGWSLATPSDSNLQCVRRRYRRHAVAVADVSLRLGDHPWSVAASECL